MHTDAMMVYTDVMYRILRIEKSLFVTSAIVCDFRSEKAAPNRGVVAAEAASPSPGGVTNLLGLCWPPKLNSWIRDSGENTGLSGKGILHEVQVPAWPIDQALR